MSFYQGMVIECVNPNNFYPWPSPEDLDCAEVVARHVALTSFQLQKLGYSSRVLSRLVKRGVLRRYKVITPEGSLPSIFSVGQTAQVIAQLPSPRFPQMETLRNILMVNQIVVSILTQTEAQVDINIRRPVQIVTVNNPLGILVARDMFYSKLPLRYDLNQAVVILNNKDLALPDLPFRYVLEEELSYDSFDIKYYSRDREGLVPVKIEFVKQEKIEKAVGTQ